MRLRKGSQTPAWRKLLVAAVVALVMAAFATLIGARGIASTAGTFAWGLALAGAIAGLVREPARDGSS